MLGSYNTLDKIMRQPINLCPDMGNNVGNNQGDSSPSDRGNLFKSDRAKDRDPFGQVKQVIYGAYEMGHDDTRWSRTLLEMVGGQDPVVEEARKRYVPGAKRTYDDFGVPVSPSYRGGD